MFYLTTHSTHFIYGSILHGGPIELFFRSCQCCMISVTKTVVCYPVCGMMHIKQPLLVIGKNSPSGCRFPLLLSEWSFTICLMPYDRKYNVLSVLLSKIFPSFFKTHI